MPFGAPFRGLVTANAPLWAGEAEAFRTYWDWPERNRESDLCWLARQCHKEFWGGGDAKRRGLFAAPLEDMSAAFEKIDRGVSRHRVLAMAAQLYQEFSHYCAFADAYDAIKTETDAGLDPWRLKDGSWPENDELSKLRARHREQYGEIGRRAHKLTEGGYCGLFREGMALKGRSAADEAIAAACTKVHADEFGHMLAGIADIAHEPLSADDWAVLSDLTTAQMRQRIHMRNAQFGYPLSEARILEILAGEIEPISFDYEQAARFLA
jgi:hypothetical protein